MNFKNTFILILVVLLVLFFFNSQFLFCGKDFPVGLSVDASSHTYTSNIVTTNTTINMVQKEAIRKISNALARKLFRGI